jgi:hypothetical protein
VHYRFQDCYAEYYFLAGRISVSRSYIRIISRSKEIGRGKGFLELEVPFKYAKVLGGKKRVLFRVM